MKAAFEVIEHPADVGFRAYGATLEELFRNSALALLSLGCAPDGVQELERREITVRAVDVESLLFSWLAEILAVGDAEQLVFSRAEVLKVVEKETGYEVRGSVYGEPFDRRRHTAGTYIKAVTYHQLSVEPTKDGWQAQVFLDV
ncbi:MAG: archease [Candidatus Acidiferrales bacterium]